MIRVSYTHIMPKFLLIRKQKIKKLKIENVVWKFQKWEDMNKPWRPAQTRMYVEIRHEISHGVPHKLWKLDMKLFMAAQFFFFFFFFFAFFFCLDGRVSICFFLFCFIVFPSLRCGGAMAYSCLSIFEILI